MRTHIVKKNVHPVYDELFEFSPLNVLSSSIGQSYVLLFTILTYDTFTRDEILGRVHFPIEEFLPVENLFTRHVTSRHIHVGNCSLLC
jgi:hypothetical protein